MKHLMGTMSVKSKPSIGRKTNAFSHDTSVPKNTQAGMLHPMDINKARCNPVLIKDYLLIGGNIQEINRRAHHKLRLTNASVNIKSRNT